MQDSQTPTKFLLPFAANAAGPYTNPIPKDSQIGIVNGAASLHDGFPPNTFISLSSGGAGPFGKDFNGLLNQITAGVQWKQAGGPTFYDATFSASVGGYPLQAVLAAVGVGGKFWISTVENNPSNPDTGGANWSAGFLGPTAWTVPLTVPNGGTGVTTLAAGVVVSNGAAAFSSLSPLDVPRGGTGQVALASNGVLVGNGAGGVLSVPKLGITQTPTQVLFSRKTSGSGTFIVPPNTTSIFCFCVAGGGGGAMANASNSGGGGGAGGFDYGWFGVTPGDSIPWIVGQGGAGGTAGNDGNIGSSSSISTFVSATPGQQGTSVANVGGGLGGVGSGGLVNGTGGHGGDGAVGNTNRAGNGGASCFGGGSRGTSTIIPPYAAPGAGGGGSYGAALLSAGNVGLAGYVEIRG